MDLMMVIETELAQHSLREDRDGMRRCKCGDPSPFAGSGPRAAVDWRRHQAEAIANTLTGRGLVQ